MDITIELENKKIKIDGGIVALVNCYRQLGKKDPEAGGILIGREDKGTGNIIIEYTTEPYENDERKRRFFNRKDNKHVETFNKLYQDNNGIYAYMGEWHTHPEDYPNYSSKDITNWRKIAKGNKHNERVYYHLIVGNKAIRVWEYRTGFRGAKRIY